MVMNFNAKMQIIQKFDDVTLWYSIAFSFSKIGHLPSRCTVYMYFYRVNSVLEIAAVRSPETTKDQKPIVSF